MSEKPTYYLTKTLEAAFIEKLRPIRAGEIPYRFSDPATFPLEFRRFREENGYSIDRLSKALGVSFTTICSWQYGRTYPSPPMRNKIAVFVASLEWEKRLNDAKARNSDETGTRDDGIPPVLDRL